MLADAHRLIALLVALGGGLVVLVVAYGEATRRSLRFARDRAILGALALVVAGSAVGLVLLVTGNGPDDPLHLLYGALAILVLPVARFWDRVSGHRALAVGIAGVVLTLLVVRLFQTG
jgi:FtsH-binding integral membrane protein